MANLVKPAKYPTASMRRTAPPAYVSAAPKDFVTHECRHERAIVYPWLYVEETWDELKHSLRSVERFFKDKECPIYIIGNKAPKWLGESDRVRFILIKEYEESRHAGLWAAWQIGMTIAKEVCWMNDDIYFLRPTGWEDLRVALTEGILDDKEEMLRSDHNEWRVALGNACAELRKRGHSPVYRFATHTPFLFEREKSIEIMREYHLAYKGSWVTLYYNHHRTPHEDCDPHKTRQLPCPGTPRYLNNHAGGPDLKTQTELLKRFGTKASWEK